MSGATHADPPLVITFRLPSVMSLTRPLREFQSLTLAQEGFSEEEIEEITLVTDEVVTNSFEHGSPHGRHVVEIDIVIEATRWTLRVRDDGEGMLTEEDLSRAGEVPPDHLGDRGRGLFLIHAFSDEVHLRSRPEGGTEITVVRKRGVVRDRP